MKRICVVVLVAVLALAACGGGDDDDTTSEATDASEEASATDAEGSTELGPGVSADKIKVAISLVDFECIADYVDEVRLDQEETYQAFIDDVNENGGVNGRMLDPIYKTHCPIPGAEPSSLTTCIGATEDDDVFAVLGPFIDFAGEAHLCVTRDHERVLITHGLAQPWIDESPSGLLLTPDITSERRLDVILTLLRNEGTLDGKKVAVLSEENSAGRIESTIEPQLAQMDVERGSDGVFTITGTDTTAAQTQLDVFIETWKSEGVDALIILGPTTSAKQFVEKIKGEVPDMLLIADATSVLGAGRDFVDSGITPNPYEGIITAEGETGEQHMQGERGKHCHEIYEAQTGKDAPGPNDVIEGPNGKRVDTYSSISDVCGEITMFVDIAKAAGPNLNIPNWRQAVDDFGPIEITSTKYASLGPGKYDADDTFGLVAFDPSIPENGDWDQITPVEDVANL